jgi:integrase
MKFVEPIRDRKKITQIKNTLRGEKRYRDLLLIVVGINLALRISDLLQLKIGQLIEDSGRIKFRFQIKEKKRGKRQEVVINNSIRDIHGEFLEAYPRIIENPQNYIFFNTKMNDFSMSIHRVQAWKIINLICKKVGLAGNFGTHTLRKSWGYHARINGVGMELIMHKLNHESLAYTKRYLGITDDELEAVVNKLNL